MVRFAKFNKKEREIVTKIIDRALDAGIYNDALMAKMDISAVHAHCPLRLDDLLHADQFNFFHDLHGIKRHISRKTGLLEHFFLPLFSR